MSVNGTVSYLLFDQLSNTTITANGNGGFISELRYKAWGEVRYRSGSTPTDYTGQYSKVDDFGLMYYNARWYDPTIARFVQADSVVPGGVQGYDRYAYVSNNPIRYTDPTGHAFDAGGASGGCKTTPCKYTGLKPGEGGGEHDGPGSNSANSSDPIIPHGYTVDCTIEHPCIGTGGYLPSQWTFHPLDSNVVSQVPIYDYSHYPPRIIGYRITSYTTDRTDVDLDMMAMTAARTFLPIPNVDDPLSVDNADIALQASEKWILRPFSEAMESLFHIESACGVCGPAGVVLKAVGLIQGANEAITTEGRLRTYDVYFQEPPIKTPFDAFP
jgi:RHS repeat-associated protein